MTDIRVSPILLDRLSWCAEQLHGISHTRWKHASANSLGLEMLARRIDAELRHLEREQDGEPMRPDAMYGWSRITGLGHTGFRTSGTG